MLGINHILTGHNADDMAETVLMNRIHPPSRIILTHSFARRHSPSRSLHRHHHLLRQFPHQTIETLQIHIREGNSHVRLLPQTRLLLHRMYLLPGSLSGHGTNPYKGPRGFATQFDFGYYSVGRGFCVKGRGEREVTGTRDV